MSDQSTLTVTRTIQADKETIFKALTDQNIMQKWFFAGPDGWSATVKSKAVAGEEYQICLLYTSPSPRDLSTSRMPSSA